MNKSKVNNNQKYIYGRLKNILSICSLKGKKFPYGIPMKHKYRLCAHGVIQQWGVNYRGTYTTVVKWLSVR